MSDSADSDFDRIEAALYKDRPSECIAEFHDAIQQASDGPIVSISSDECQHDYKPAPPMICCKCGRHGLPGKDYVRVKSEGGLSEGVAELIERLVIANLKLFAVCEEKKQLVDLEQSGQPVDQHELLDNIRKDLDLCRSRAAIRAEINKRLGSFSGEVVKTY